MERVKEVFKRQTKRVREIQMEILFHSPQFYFSLNKLFKWISMKSAIVQLKIATRKLVYFLFIALRRRCYTNVLMEKKNSIWMRGYCPLWFILSPKWSFTFDMTFHSCSLLEFLQKAYRVMFILGFRNGIYWLLNFCVYVQCISSIREGV